MAAAAMRLTAAEITTRLTELPGWTREADALVRTFVFAGFPDAIAFVTRLAFDAESADHHPDLSVSYKKVRVSWTTHSADGITDKDVNGARQSDAIAARLGSKA